MSNKNHELLILRKHISSPTVIGGARVTHGYWWGPCHPGLLVGPVSPRVICGTRVTHVIGGARVARLVFCSPTVISGARVARLVFCFVC